MIKLKKYGVIVGTVILIFIVGMYYTFYGISLSNKKTAANTRILFIEKTNIDYQTVLNGFQDVRLFQDSSITIFEGHKAVPLSLFDEIANVNLEENDALSNCNVSYSITYDSDSNIVTLSAEMTNVYGEIFIDTLSGVGFINKMGKIDAVMNIEGEGVLLSEMCDADTLQNCGWFGNMFKKIIKTVAIAAAAVAVAAVIVSTAGVAATAVVGVGVASVVASSSAAIAGYATLTAAIAAGVDIASNMIQELEWQGVKYKMKELTDDLRLRF